MSLRRAGLSLTALVLLVSGGYWAYLQFLAPVPEEREPSVAAVNSVTLEDGANVVSAEGQVVPARQVVLSFQVSGQIQELSVVEGAMVQAGEPLVRLDTADAEHNLSQAEAVLAQAEANLTASTAGVMAAQAAVTVAESGVTAAETQLSLLLADPSAEQISAAEQNIAIAEASVTQAEANRDLALEIPTSQIRAAEAQVAAAQAEKDVLQEQYDTLLRNGVGGTAEEQVRSALNAAVASLNSAQTLLDELTAGPTAAQRRAADTAVDLAIAQRDAAIIQLDLLLAEPRSEQVAVAQAEIGRAEAIVAQADAAVAQAEAAVTQAEAGLSQAQASVDAVHATLDKMVLAAPFAGIVADVGVEVGETVAPGIPVLTLADTSAWSIETTDLTERDVVAVAVGQEAEIRIDALPNETFIGTVTKIADVATSARGDVTYVVTIQLGKVASPPLRWGMTAFVDIEVDS